MNEGLTPAPVAVIIPCRNMAAFLGRAIDSALAQRPPPAEIVVIDDRSTDDPAAVIDRYGGRVRLIAGPGKGSAIARNLGILATSGEFVAFLDADDHWREGHLAQALDALAAPDVGFTCSNWRHAADGHEGEPLFGSYYTRMTSGDVFTALLRENWVLTSSVVVRRAVLALSGVFDPALIGAQDYDLWLRLARVTELASLPQPTAVKHGHAGNITAKPNYAYHLARLWTTIARRFPDLPPTDLKYVARRESEALVAAGLQAIRNAEPAVARSYLWRYVGRRPWSLHGWAALCLAFLPPPVVRVIKAVKRGDIRAA